MAFSINDRGTGYQITFLNGYTISIQFGPGTYSSHYEDADMVQPGTRPWTSELAEIAIWDEHNKWYSFSGTRTIGHKEVLGWQSPDEVAEWVSRVAKWPRPSRR